MVTLDQLKSAIEASWTKETAFSASEWTLENPARGQCVPTALVVQHFFGGDLQKLTTIINGKPEAHYRNILPDGSIEDLTSQQYTPDQPFEAVPVVLHGFSSIRQKRLHDPNARARYELLLSLVMTRLQRSQADGFLNF